MMYSIMSSAYSKIVWLKIECYPNTFRGVSTPVYMQHPWGVTMGDALTHQGCHMGVLKRGVS